LIAGVYLYDLTLGNSALYLIYFAWSTLPRPT